MKTIDEHIEAILVAIQLDGHKKRHAWVSCWIDIARDLLKLSKTYGTDYLLQMRIDFKLKRVEFLAQDGCPVMRGFLPWK